MGVGLTAFVFALAIRDALHPRHTRGLLLSWFFSLHGWPLIGVNVALYAYLGWLAFCFIRGTESRERVFMVGWFVGILLRPVEVFLPSWVAAVRYFGAFGLAVALLAAVSLLLNPPRAVPAATDGPA